PGEVRRARRPRRESALRAARKEMPRQQVSAFGGVRRGLGWAGDDWSADTRVPGERLRAIGEALVRLPADFTPSARVRKLLEDRQARIAPGEALGWGAGGAAADGRLLVEGRPQRVSGRG